MASFDPGLLYYRGSLRVLSAGSKEQANLKVVLKYPRHWEIVVNKRCTVRRMLSQLAVNTMFLGTDRLESR